MNRASLYLLVILLFASCSVKQAQESSDAFPPIFPDYTSAFIPKNIAPLNFEVADASFIRVDISQGKNKLITLTGERHIQLPEKKWKEWLTRFEGEKLEFRVSVWSDTYKKGLQYKPFSIEIATSEIDEWIAYRLIEPGYEFWNQMGIYQRRLSDFTEKAIVTNEQNNQGCVNCHAFHQYSAKEFMFHARGKNGGTILVQNGTPRRIDFKKLSSEVRATYPFWHPSGKYLVFSSNETYQSFYHAGKMPVEVYDVASDMFIYSIDNNQVLTDPRFTEDSRFETFPSFSPDGDYLYYCSAEAKKMPQENKELFYGLYRVPFDVRTGALGNPVDTIIPASPERSVSFPRLSPDGKYLLYTRSVSATFPIWHKEADLEMINLENGEAMDTQALNSPEAESYHSWSSNGKWVLFSSRRMDGRYTRLFIAGIREDGTFHKPFLLPQEDPIQNQLRLKSYNIPEFIQEEVILNKSEITRLFD